MARIATKDIIPIFRARARLTELADDQTPACPIAREGETHCRRMNAPRRLPVVVTRSFERALEAILDHYDSISGPRGLPARRACR